ncbi:hypothetical protein R3P38DRAFT_3240170 [Favolaschia claudopus]|uniref:Uncharacterized protein n=1 Tax=Favolaschia claudopus TaxID=2862362 RepID=A0AAV9Z6X0_9AGAR
MALQPSTGTTTDVRSPNVAVQHIAGGAPREDRSRIRFVATRLLRPGDEIRFGASDGGRIADALEQILRPSRPILSHRRSSPHGLTISPALQTVLREAMDYVPRFTAPQAQMQADGNGSPAPGSVEDVELSDLELGYPESP